MRCHWLQQFFFINGDAMLTCFARSPSIHLPDLIQVTQHLKWATKFHRVRGVHVTPTVFVNGLEVRELGERNSMITLPKTNTSPENW